MASVGLAVHGGASPTFPRRPTVQCGKTLTFDPLLPVTNVRYREL